MQDDSVVGCLESQRQDDFYKVLLDLSVPQQRARQERLVLPSFIPLVKDAIPEIPESRSGRIYAISMETLLSRSGDLRIRSPEHLRKQIGLSPTARVALIGTVKDPKLELFWTHSTDRDVWRRIAQLGFEFVTGCTFSVWYKHPRFDQIYNQQRNLLTHDLMSSLGVPCIPFLMFSKDRLDYEENISWLRNRPDVRIVAVRGQFRREEYEFLELIDEMRALSADVSRPLHFLVVGGSQQHRIARILREFSATIVSGTPFLSAINWRRASHDLRFRKVQYRKQGIETLFVEDEEISKCRLVLHNLEQYENYCDSFSARNRKSASRTSPSS